MVFDIEDYNYDLPEERIAKYPLENREDSKLLVYRKGSIRTDQFKNVLEHLPSGSYLLFNDTKVIAARLYFHKATGALIELFLLEPRQPSREMSRALEAKRTCVWECVIGNKKKWKPEQKLVFNFSFDDQHFHVSAEYIDFEKNLIKFAWNGDQSFAEVIENIGRVPIPPYLKRSDELLDKNRYQTVYSQNRGAVAAPTAGLHFTNNIISSLSSKNIGYGFVTLHVSAGTFKPVQEKDYRKHQMHNEQIFVSRKVIKDILGHDSIYCVGTTSLRTLESLYWIGAKLLEESPNPFHIEQYVYDQFSPDRLPTSGESLKAVLAEMDRYEKDTLSAKTEIFIFPGYSFQLCRGLFTNFHLPKSTLLLLVSAFIGEDWRKIYERAKIENFRFLSYGDTSFLQL